MKTKSLKYRSKTEGFSMVEGILLFVLIGIISGTGWYVFKAQQKTKKTFNQTADTSIQIPTKKAPELSSPAASLTPDEAVEVPTPEAQKNKETGTVSGMFVQNNNVAWPNTQKEAYIGLNVSDETQVSKVEWYLGSEKPELIYTKTQPSVGNLFQYNWPIGSLPKGTYHWTAKVYDKQGNYQLVKNKNGDASIDMLVKSQ